MPRTKGSKNRVTASTDFDAQIAKLQKDKAMLEVGRASDPEIHPQCLLHRQPGAGPADSGQSRLLRLERRRGGERAHRDHLLGRGR